MKGITGCRQRIIKMMQTNFLDQPDYFKIAGVLALLCVFLMQTSLYVELLSYWDNASAVVYTDHVIELQHTLLIMFGVCLMLIFCLYVIYKIKSTFLLAYCKYLFIAIAAIILFMLDAYFGSINLASGIMAASIPLFVMVAFERQLAFFIVFIATCGFMLLGYLVSLGIIPLDYLYIGGFFSHSEHYLFYVLTSLYFALPMFLLSVLSFDRLLNHRHEREQSVLELSQLDELTGLFNRRTICQNLSSQIQDTATKEPISVMLVDLDHFKRINDTFGHLIGDQIICHVAKTLHRSLRQADVIGRYGGEEFLVMLRNTAAAEAFYIAERCRLNIEAERSLLVQGRSLSITASFGVYSFMAGDETLETIIQRVDELLYHAKESGRNCTCILEKTVC